MTSEDLSNMSTNIADHFYMDRLCFYFPMHAVSQTWKTHIGKKLRLKETIKEQPKEGTQDSIRIAFVDTPEIIRYVDIRSIHFI